MNDLGHTLDKFQIDAIRAQEKGQNIIVGAPTGSGKIQIAESFIKRCLASNNRAIYIPPTNALSHQRFRDWSHRFGERVGIETRDVSVRSDAPLRIMTNETFRSAIFDHSHSLDAVEYVIFDELQNMTDGVEFLSGTVKQGTAWEECILFAPQHIRFLCLSLPFPNLKELARWLEHVRSHEVIMIRKIDRPIEHACFIEHFGSGTPKIIEQIRASSPEAQKQFLNQPDADVIEFVCTQEELPCLYFCDSHKRCESLAFDYAERELFPFHPEAVTQYDAICHARGIVQEGEAVPLRECLASGIAFYHEGLLPSLKAVVEQMLIDGLIQLIFTTEASVVGSDLPVNSVILDGLEKFDGTRLRYLKPQEYHQIVGRGRRVYACVDPFKTDAETVRHIFNGDFEAFDFHLDLSYATILNLYDRLSVAAREKGEQKITKLGNCEIDENDATRSTQYSDWLQKSFCYFQSRNQLNQNATPDDNELLPVECIHDQPHLIVEYQQLSEALSPQKTALKKRQRELRRTKRNEKQRVAQALDELKSSIQQLETKRDALLCADCPHRGECMQRSQKLQKAQREANRLTQRKTIDFLTLDELDRRIAFLKSMGYIQHGQLTPKGSCASQLHDHEIQTTELLFDGYFDWLDEVQVNIMASAIGFEPKVGTTYKPLDQKRLGFDLAVLEKRVQRLAERQRVFGIQRPFKMLDMNCSGVVHAWSNAAKFSELVRYTNAGSGDIVHGLRGVIRLLRQLEGVLPKGTELCFKIGRCIARMNRGVVDADTELNLGTK